MSLPQPVIISNAKPKNPREGMLMLYEKYLADFKAMDKHTRGKRKSIQKVWCEKLTQQTGRCSVFRDFETGEILARAHQPNCSYYRG